MQYFTVMKYNFAMTWSCAIYTAHIITLSFCCCVKKWRLISEVIVIYDQSPFNKSVYLSSSSAFALKLKTPDGMKQQFVDMTIGLLSPPQVCLYTLKMAMMIWMTVSAIIILYLTPLSAILELFSCFVFFFQSCFCKVRLHCHLHPTRLFEIVNLKIDSVLLCQDSS